MSIYDEIKETNVIAIPQGKAYKDTVKIQTPDPAFPDDRTLDKILNLTGYTVQSQLRSLSGHLVAAFECTAPAPETGVINRSLPKEVTAALINRGEITHVWGVELINPAGDKLPEIQGGAAVGVEVVR